MSLANIMNGLLSFWRLEEASGTRIDSAGTLNMSPSGSVGSKPGQIGFAADFTGGHLTGGTSSSLNFDGTGDFTIAGWFNADDVSTDRGIISKYVQATNNKQWGVFVDDVTPRHVNFIVSGDGIVPDQAGFGTTAILINTWYFFWAAYTASSDDMSVQVNQGAISSITGPSSIFTGTGNPRIGVQDLAGGDFLWDGLIDELGVWNRLLTTAEKASLYNNGDAADIFGLAAEGPDYNYYWKSRTRV